MPTVYEPGAMLEVRGAMWRLAHAQPFETCTLLTLEGRDRATAGDRLRVIDPFDRPRAASRRKLRRRPRRAVLTAAWAAIASARPPLGLWTAATATIALWPYQLEPALAVIRGATRVLLADAVGLGKTVQAGLILSELRERGWIAHALIVCPAGLRDTWARELRDRFGITAAVLDHTSIAERIAWLPPGVSPWSGHAIAIASIDYVKRPEVLAAIAAESIDLLIVDEAHHLAPGTDRGAAIARLASRSPWCVLASATPHSGDRNAFDYLTAIGTAEDALVIFRRQRPDVGLAVARRTHFLAVNPTPPERALIDAVAQYARAIWHARGRDDHSVRLVASTLARRAASSPAAIARTLLRRLALLAASPVAPAQPALPWEDIDPSDEGESAMWLGAPGLANEAEERAALEHLSSLTTCCGAGAKMLRLRRILAAVREPAVVFTEYRDTLEAIVSALVASDCRVAAIHGGLVPELRRAAVDAFNDGRIDVLVATDAAGEGLNLHHRCRLVIDIELPWNPLRLEQRIGRVDRLGQQRTVHAIRLFHPDSIERTVLDRLRLRSQRAERAFDGDVSDRDVAAAVFDEAPIRDDRVRIQSAAIDSGRAECDRLNRQRRLSHPPREITRVWCAPRHRRPARLIALTRTRFINDSGCLAGERVDAYRIFLHHPPRHRREWRAAIEHVEKELLTGTVGTLGTPGTLGTSIERRIAAIRARLRREHAIRYQRSLFDSRADADATARQAVCGRLDASLHRALGAATAPISPEGARAELIALWPERP
jgi:superfamily II DNA or RNA helicase